MPARGDARGWQQYERLMLLVISQDDVAAAACRRLFTSRASAWTEMR